MTLSMPLHTKHYTPNIWPGRRGRIVSIVCHTIGGYFNSLPDWFGSTGSIASTNFAVSLDGRIQMYVNPFGKDAPFANGYLANPDDEVKFVLQQINNANLNFHTVSIEHEDQLITRQINEYPSMFRASTLLSAFLCQEFQLDPFARGTFLGHYQIDAVNRPFCPGWTAATWDIYIDEVARLLGKLEVPDVEYDALVSTVDAQEKRIARLERLLAGNGINWEFITDPTTKRRVAKPGAGLKGEAALAHLDKNGVSVTQSVYALNDAIHQTNLKLKV